MLYRSGRDAAVSPVIGTILLVAISVILVAVIVMVVMGFSGDTNEKKVGLNAKSETGNNATLILYGGASIPDLVKLEMIDHNSPDGRYVEVWDINDNGSVNVGIPYLAKDVAKPLEDMNIYDTRINVKGTFTDGREVVLLIQPMTFFDVVGSESDDSPVPPSSPTLVTVTGYSENDVPWASGITMGTRLGITRGVTVEFTEAMGVNQIKSVAVTINGANTVDGRYSATTATTYEPTNIAINTPYKFRLTGSLSSEPSSNIPVPVIVTVTYKNNSKEIIYSGDLIIPPYPRPAVILTVEPFSDTTSRGIFVTFQEIGTNTKPIMKGISVTVNGVTLSGPTLTGSTILLDNAYKFTTTSTDPLDNVTVRVIVFQGTSGGSTSQTVIYNTSLTIPPKT